MYFLFCSIYYQLQYLPIASKLVKKKKKKKKLDLLPMEVQGNTANLCSKEE